MASTHHILVPDIHPNAFKGTKTVNPATATRTVVINGRTFKVRPSKKQRGNKKNWFNAAELGLKEAILEDNADLVTEIIKANPEFINAGANLKKDTPLSVAAEHGKPNALTALIGLGADVNKALSDMSVSTPLMSAAKKNHHVCVKALVQGGAVSIDKVDKMGRSALHYAVQNDHVDATEALLAAGANVNARDYHYRTPLVLACKSLAKHDGKVVPVLLKYGARLDDQDGYDEDPKTGKPIGGGKTALHYAVMYNRFKLVSLLVESGATITLRDDNTVDKERGVGDLPLRPVDYARRNTPTRKFLIEKEAALKAQKAGKLSVVKEGDSSA